ncbi:MAG: DUF547 domain-containing protein [Flavobacteriaceae bacterium]
MKVFIKIFTLIILSQSVESCSLLSAAGLSSQGQPVKKVSENLNSLETIIIDHSDWDQLLKKHVNSEGLVDYKGFLEDRNVLQEYLKMLSKNPPSESWSVQELLAYYSNIYNAATIELILENYPVNSIKDINGAWTKAIVTVGDKTLSLGGIENGILRKMNEPRIHFAINCASFSCPNLLNEAFTADKIDSQLDKVTRNFINGPKNEIGITSVTLSKIFDWYKKDYVINGKNDVIGFVNSYLNKKIKINPKATITYFEYDWGLNEQK